MIGLAARLRQSESIEELECVGVTLWAVTANCEKGKVAAKRAGCVSSLQIALQRLRKWKTSSLQEQKCTLDSVIGLLEKVSSVQSSSASASGNGDAAADLDNTYRDD
jgi:hypothetical protein